MRLERRCTAKKTGSIASPLTRTLTRSDLRHPSLRRAVPKPYRTCKCPSLRHPSLRRAVPKLPVATKTNKFLSLSILLIFCQYPIKIFFILPISSVNPASILPLSYLYHAYILLISNQNPASQRVSVDWSSPGLHHSMKKCNAGEPHGNTHMQTFRVR